MTVDLTPPTGRSHFTLVTMDTTYSTIPLFVDIESGISGMEIALGSQPGSSDLLEWTAASYGNGIGTYINQAGIRDGQLVFASIQVYILHHSICNYNLLLVLIPFRYGTGPD